MAAIKSYTDIEQSKKLAEILPIESADMCWYLATKGNSKAMFNEEYNEYGDFELPCWSLAALFNALPEDCGIDKENSKYVASYITSDECDAYTESNPIDACYNMIIKLHEIKML